MAPSRCEEDWAVFVTWNSKVVTKAHGAGIIGQALSLAYGSKAEESVARQCWSVLCWRSDHTYENHVRVPFEGLLGGLATAKAHIIQQHSGEVINTHPTRTKNIAFWWVDSIWQAAARRHTLSSIEAPSSVYHR